MTRPKIDGSDPHGTCRTCGADLIWARSKTDKPIPLDAAPVADGNLELKNGRAIYVRPGSPNLFGVPRYVSHFATCPDATHHRKDTKP